MFDRLQKESKHKWERQFIFGHTIFDFFCRALGVAIEVDGKTHWEAWDANKDRAHLEKFGIVTLRIRNSQQEDLDLLMKGIKHAGYWKRRLKKRGLILSPETETNIKNYNKHTKKLNRAEGRKKAIAKKFEKRFKRKPTKHELSECIKEGLKRATRHLSYA